MGSVLKIDDTIYGQPIEVLGHLPGWLMVAVLSVMTASVTEVRKYLIIVTGGVDDLKILGASTNLVGLIYPNNGLGLSQLASVSSCKAAIDVGRKQYRPKQLK